MTLADVAMERATRAAQLEDMVTESQARLQEALKPIPMLLWCPKCLARHIDKGEFATKPHHTHACQSCGMVWRCAIVMTVGVEFLPGFKDAEGT